MMRVITGSARGCRLESVPGDDVRPTSEMVKESIFNIIQFDIEGRRVLDLFSGSGQLGIEALSRGAESCDFVDEGAASIKVTKKNLEHTKLDGKARVVSSDAVSFLENLKGKYQLVFLDPPYDTGLMDSCLAKIELFDICTPGGIIVCESDAKKEMPELASPYSRGREYIYGRRKLTVYKRDGLGKQV